jgi:chromosome segregation ATPase
LISYNTIRILKLSKGRFNMNPINLNAAKTFFLHTLPTAVGTFSGKAVTVISANPMGVAAVVIAIAIIIIGVKCYRSYNSLKLEFTILKGESESGARETTRIQNLCNAEFSKIADLESSRSKLGDENKYVKELIGKKAEELYVLNNKHNLSLAEIVDLKEEVKNLRNQLETAHSNIQTSEKEKLSLIEQVNGMKSEKDLTDTITAESIRETSSTKISKKEASPHALLASKESTMSDLEKANSELRSEVENLKTQNKILAEKEALAKAQLTADYEALSTLSKQLEDVNYSKRGLSEENKRLAEVVRSLTPDNS